MHVSTVHTCVIYYYMFYLIIQKLVCEDKFFDIPTLNKALVLLNFQYMDDNKPTPLEQSCLSNGSFRQNGESSKSV